MFDRLRYFVKIIIQARQLKTQGFTGPEKWNKAISLVVDRQLKAESANHEVRQSVSKYLTAYAVATQKNCEQIQQKEFGEELPEADETNFGKSHFSRIDADDFTKQELSNLLDPYSTIYHESETQYVIPQALLELIRSALFTWDGTEAGAPRVDGISPFGSQNPLNKMGELFNITDKGDQIIAYAETVLALNNFVKTAEIVPGCYTIKNTTTEMIFAQMSGYGFCSPIDIGFRSDGKYHLTTEMITLIKNLQFEWSNRHLNENLRLFSALLSEKGLHKEHRLIIWD